MKCGPTALGTAVWCAARKVQSASLTAVHKFKSVLSGAFEIWDTLTHKLKPDGR